MSIDLEYAIKQDIRNNPVVREVDRAQKREFFRTLGLAVLMVGMLMFALMPRTNLTTNGYQLEKIRKAIAEEQIYQQQYRLELATLLRPQEVEQRAARELQMVEPTGRDTLMLERVPATKPAAGAIVAVVR